jgi:hypothetical protein
MNPFRLLVLLAISSVLPAFAGQAATLAADSPFLPREKAGAEETAPSSDTVELRGVMSSSTGYLYYVYDSAKKRGVWAGSGDTEFPFTIVAADAIAGHLDLRMNDGRLLHLRLREAKVMPGGVSAAAPQAVVANAAVVPGRGAVRLTETQAAWRDELQRRLAENAAKD